jgi:hypothetical protein
MSVGCKNLGGKKAAPTGMRRRKRAAKYAKPVGFCRNWVVGGWVGVSVFFGLLRRVGCWGFLHFFQKQKTRRRYERCRIFLKKNTSSPEYASVRYGAFKPRAVHQKL